MSETASVAAIRTGRLPHAAGGTSGMARAAALVSLGLHAAILCATVLAISPPAPPPALSFALEWEPPADAPLSTLAAGRLPPPSTIAVDRLTRALPGRMIRATMPAEPSRTRHAAPTQPAAATPASPPAREAPSPGDVAGLKLRIRDAVRAATLYPAVARQMHREGRAQIGFAYRDGAVQGIALLHSSRSGLLDEAALAAVRRAAYPQPPPGLTGVQLPLDVWVNFGLKAE